MDVFVPLLSRTFHRPHGWFGRIGGALMSWANAATEQQMVSVANPTSEDTVIVLGPGPGVGLAATAEQAQRTVGVDPSQDMLELCRKRCAEEIDKGIVDVYAGTAAAIGELDSSADIVLSVNNVQLWDD